MSKSDTINNRLPWAKTRDGVVTNVTFYTEGACVFNRAYITKCKRKGVYKIHTLTWFRSNIGSECPVWMYSIYVLSSCSPKFTTRLSFWDGRKWIVGGAYVKKACLVDKYYRAPYEACLAGMTRLQYNRWATSL